MAIAGEGGRNGLQVYRQKLKYNMVTTRVGCSFCDVSGNGHKSRISVASKLRNTRES